MTTYSAPSPLSQTPREGELKRLYEAKESAASQLARYEQRIIEEGSRPGLEAGKRAMLGLIERLSGRITCALEGRTYRVPRRRGGVEF